jgi:hypothetical protein
LLALGAIGNAMNPESSTSSASPSATASVAEASSPSASSASPDAESPSVESVEPTAAPTVEPTAEPPAPAAPILKKTSGRGDKIVRFNAQEAPTVARITAKGSGNFSVVSYVGSEYNSLLVNVIGAYAGWVYVAESVDRLQIESSGTWTVEINPITAARKWTGEEALTGKGDAVVMVSGGASGITTIKNKSSSNFSVVAYTPEGEYLDLIVNEIGSYSGEVLLPDADPMVLQIGAVGGTWSMSAISQ